MGPRPPGWRLGFLLSAGDGIGKVESRLQMETVRITLGYPVYRSRRWVLSFRVEGVVSKYLPSAGDKWLSRLGTGHGGRQLGREVGVVPGLVLGLRVGRLWPYVEFGSGLVYSDFEGELTGFQSPGLNFRSHLGFGAKVGLWDGASLDLGFRYSHVSNASLRDPNNGLDFVEYMGRIRIEF